MSKDELIAAVALAELISSKRVLQEVVSLRKEQEMTAASCQVMFATPAATCAIDHHQPGFSSQQHQHGALSQRSFLVPSPQARAGCPGWSSSVVHNHRGQSAQSVVPVDKTHSTTAASLGQNRSTIYPIQTVFHSTSVLCTTEQELAAETLCVKGSQSSSAMKRSGARTLPDSKMKQTKARAHEDRILLERATEPEEPQICVASVTNLQLVAEFMRQQERLRQAMTLRAATSISSPLLPFILRTTQSLLAAKAVHKTKLPSRRHHTKTRKYKAIVSKVLPCIPRSHEVQGEKRAPRRLGDPVSHHVVEEDSSKTQERETPVVTVSEFLRSLAVKKSCGGSFQGR